MRTLTGRCVLVAVTVVGFTASAWAQAPAPTPQAPPPATATAPAPAPAAQPASPAAASPYVGSEACKTCHEAVFDSWVKTKHAKTINRLNGDERQAGSKCVTCHITGPEPVVVDGTLTNANVGCESCHGAGKAHVESAGAGAAKPAGVTKKPAAPVCEKCHNDKSPHFRGFYYSALVGLVHKKGT